MPPRFIARHLARPTGWLGGVVAQLMNWNNGKPNLFAVQQLQLSSTDRVLEIGFGGGIILPVLLESAEFVCGVDHSPDAVKRAKARFAKAVQAGRADFREGSIDALPCGTAAFNKVCTANTVYFCKSLDAGFSEIYRVLKPGGLATVEFLPKEHMDRGNFPADIFTSRAPEEVIAALTKAGFKDIRVERATPATRWNVLVAIR